MNTTEYNAAKVMSGIISTTIKSLPSTNPNQFFLEGQSLLTKEEFNHLNRGEDDYVHGFSVFFGPYNTLEECESFVRNYPKDLWPAYGDWVVRHTGQVQILSGYRPETHQTIVDNLATNFQPHLAMKQQQKKAQEIQEVKDKMRKLEENPEKLTSEQLDMLIRQHKEKILRTEQNLEGQLDYLKTLQNLKNK